jgi:hypothetical protein
MQDKIEEILNEIDSVNFDTLQGIEEYRIKWLGKKGSITELF